MNLGTPAAAAPSASTAPAQGEPPVIEVEGLVKTFGRHRALDELDLTVHRGQVHGFLGPNGSGKSTTIRVLLGLMRADAGTVRLFGADPWADAVTLHRRLAYVPGDVTLWPGLSGGQCIDVLARAHGEIDEARRAELVERFELDEGKRARDYSKGNRQKVSLVAALASRAELLVLDEPTSGLDPLMEQVFQEVVRERADQGATVLLSSHILSEVEALADRVSIIRAGRTVASGTLASLRQHTSSQVHAVTERPVAGIEQLEGVTDHVAAPARSAGVAASAGEGARAELVDTRFHVTAEALPQAVGRVHAAGVRTLTVTPPSLNDLFLHEYRSEGSREPRDGARA